MKKMSKIFQENGPNGSFHGTVQLDFEKGSITGIANEMQVYKEDKNILSWYLEASTAERIVTGILKELAGVKPVDTSIEILKRDGYESFD
jgi:hypothetical protein